MKTSEDRTFRQKKQLVAVGRSMPRASLERLRVQCGRNGVKEAEGKSDVAAAKWCRIFAASIRILNSRQSDKL